MKKIQRVLCMLISFALLLTLLAGCGGTSGKGNDQTQGKVESSEEQKNTQDQSEKVEATKTELVVATISGPTADRLKNDADSFMKLNPDVTVKVDEYEQVQYKEQAPRLLLSDSKPDVAWYWSDRWYHTIVKSGALIPLDELYESEGWNKALPDSIIKQYTSPDGKKYSVNTDIVWCPVVYYNKKAFTKAGVNPPKTFDEWFGMADKFKSAGYIPLVTGAGDGYVSGHVWDAVLVRNVAPDKYEKLLDRSKKYDEIGYTSPEVIETWSIMKKMADSLFPKGVAGIKDDEARALFVQGKAAAYSNGSWAAGEGMLGKELPKDFELGFFFYPQVKSDIKPTQGIYAGNALMAVKNTGKEELAKKFIAHVMSKERQSELPKNKVAFPSRTDLGSEAIKPMGDIFVAMYDELGKIGGSTLWDGDIPGEMATLSFQLHQAVLSGEKTPEAAGKEMQTLFEKILAESK